MQSTLLNRSTASFFRRNAINSTLSFQLSCSTNIEMVKFDMQKDQLLHRAKTSTSTFLSLVCAGLALALK